MTTINTTDDLLALLDENEQCRNAVRHKILTEELIKLPHEFEDFKKETKNRFDGIDTRFDGIDTRLRRIGDDVGDLKGHFAGRAAREDAAFIAAEMGLEWNRTLERVEVLHIWQAADRNGLTEGISREDRRSFLRPDIIMDTLDAQGKQCYVAVEMSYTAHTEDTDRAIRSADYLTRFTGVPTYMAVAGVFKHSEIDDVITEEGPEAFDVSQDSKVFWLELEDLGSPD